VAQLRSPDDIAFMTRSILTLFVAVALLPCLASAKRAASEKVEPAIYEGVRYVAPNDDVRRAHIEAWDIQTNKKLWDLTIFTNQIDPNLEEDLQWVFIQDLSIQDGALMVKSERGQTYQVDLKTKAIKQSDSASSPPLKTVQIMPEVIGKAIANGSLAKAYDISSQIEPSYLQADFTGDGKNDVAVLVKQRASGKPGIAIIHGGTSKPAILGAGVAIGNGGDDFEWMDYWQVYPKGRVTRGSGEKATAHLRGDALLVGKSEAASALIYWNGKRYVWLQQGD
jgi:hypothetical protein